jgi:hypothetical protein
MPKRACRAARARHERRGEVVTDLDRRRSAYEDGRRQSIALFRRDDVPISLA